jgi:two-component system, OmpR family, response regulator ChvI
METHCAKQGLDLIRSFTSRTTRIVARPLLISCRIMGLSSVALPMPFLWLTDSPSPVRLTSSFSTGTFQTISGIEVLVALRQCGVDLPVVFLTGYGFTDQENLAFEAGAVDFVDKARGVEILARRLRRLLKAPKPAAVPSASIVCGKLLLNPNVGRAYWNDRDVGLTLGEYNIVHLLASKAGRWVTYRTVYDRAHYEGFIGGSGEDGYQTNVRGTIRRIRKKFLQCDETFAENENFVGLGYRWANAKAAG